VKYRKRGLIWTTDAFLGVLLLVIVVAATLIYAPTFMTLARENQARADTAALAKAISQFEMDVGRYPTSLNELTDCSSVSNSGAPSGWSYSDRCKQYGPFIKEIPKDPFNVSGNKHQSYKYRAEPANKALVDKDGINVITNMNKGFIVYSIGPNGRDENSGTAIKGNGTKTMSGDDIGFIGY